MVSAINIYVEGGGDSKVTKTKLREGFSTFFKELRDIAQSKRIRWNIIACGGRNAAYDDFCVAVRTAPEAFNVLLVDAEGPVKAPTKTSEHEPWQHLKQRDDWNRPDGVDDTHCFLMVQSMETWLIADENALKEFYGQGFLENALPDTADIEAVDRKTLIEKLELATAKTQKGKYHKTKHAFDILKNANAKTVRQAAPHCERLFKTLADKMVAARVS